MVQKNKWVAVVYIFALLYLLSSCQGSIKDTQVPGVYVSNFEGANYIISLSRDHRYSYKQLNGQLYISRNEKWSFKDGRINFENFKLSASKNSINGIWSAEIKVVNGEIRIIYADEEGYYYKRLKISCSYPSLVGICNPRPKLPWICNPRTGILHLWGSLNIELPAKRRAFNHHCVTVRELQISGNFRPGL